MYDLDQKILRVNMAGMPLSWVNYQEAARFYYNENVAYSLGQRLFRLRGGINAITGERSAIEINSIIATHGQNPTISDAYTPPLNSMTLFRRDSFMCMYCGEQLQKSELSRDHIVPLNQGGRDEWSNVITACKRCNNHKAGRTPEQAGMKLLAIPFTPTHAEYIYLQARKVLADQMEFLKAHFPRSSRLKYNS